MRYPQVLCIISQHTWFPLYNKVRTDAEDTLAVAAMTLTVQGSILLLPRPWLCLQVLEVVEQLLKQTAILNQPDSNQDLPFSHPAGQFLTALCQQCPNPPLPGRIFR